MEFPRACFSDLDVISGSRRDLPPDLDLSQPDSRADRWLRTRWQSSLRDVLT